MVGAHCTLSRGTTDAFCYGSEGSNDAYCQGAIRWYRGMSLCQICPGDPTDPQMKKGQTHVEETKSGLS